MKTGSHCEFRVMLSVQSRHLVDQVGVVAQLCMPIINFVNSYG